MSDLTQQIWYGFLTESSLILFMEDLINFIFYTYATPCITTEYDFIFYITGADCPRFRMGLLTLIPYHSDCVLLSP